LLYLRSALPRLVEALKVTALPTLSLDRFKQGLG
jgi:hypothetical protein